MRISLIVAVAENDVIGRGGRLPWHLSDDLRRFKRLTMGHTIIMGRRTWESIGRPLPGRRMVVVSRQPGYHIDAEGIRAAVGLDQALQMANSAGDEEAFIIGGEDLYRAALPRADRLYVTRVHAAVPGDTYFPNVDWQRWYLMESEKHEANETNEFPYSFEIYDRQASDA